MSAAFPPPTFTTPANILPAYLYQEYNDDDNVRAFFTAYNILAQGYLDWFNTINLPIYTGLSSALLDWIAQGIYGLARPTISAGSVSIVGPLNTWAMNQIPLNESDTLGSVTLFTVSDDIFKRIITWHFFKGDGQQFCTTWLKRRIMRFLTGLNGTSPNIDNTYPISVAFAGSGAVTITITVDPFYAIQLATAQIFQAGVASGAIPFPFQLSPTIDIVNNGINLSDDGGWLVVASAASYPTSPTGLPAGAVWSNGGVVSVVPGVTPNPAAAALFFGQISALGLASIGAGNLPLTNPGIGTSQLWNQGGIVSIA